ncbi:MAG TPA: dihydrolipoamide acetyltransferase family protein [Pirellulales bacterium]
MIEITVPRLGWSMEEGTFSAWLKNDGDWIEKGDLLFVLESDKASQEIESFDAGVLRIGPDGPQRGETVQVGQVIGYLAARDEVPDFAAVAVETPCEVVDDVLSSPSHQEMTVATAEAGHDCAPRVQGSGFREETPVVALAASPERDSGNGAAVSEPVASPRARRAAREHGVDWRRLSGSGREGRVRERDVLAAISPAGEIELPAAPISTVRRTIAERMLASVHSTAPVTLTTKVNAANLVNLRDVFKTASREAAPTITDIVVKLTAQALAEHPGLNARWQNNQIVLNNEINIGIAVDTLAGLLVPVVRNVPDLGLKQLAAASRALVERARESRLTPAEMQGGTFTVTNLGMYGIDVFTPIINPSEAAILGLGAIRREAVVVEDRLVAGQTITLNLTFDHRIIDGAPAARFLQLVGQLIENPVASLV